MNNTPPYMKWKDIPKINRIAVITVAVFVLFFFLVIIITIINAHVSTESTSTESTEIVLKEPVIAPAIVLKDNEPIDAPVNIPVYEPAIEYTIVEQSNSLTYTLSYAIRIKKEATEAELKTIARELYEPGFNKIFIDYYAPGMIVKHGAYATSHFTPDLEIRIYGREFWENMRG